MPTYLSGETDDGTTDDENAEPEKAEDDVQYDLAGNPLPRAARPPAASVLAPGEPPHPPPSPVLANFSRSAPPSLSFATLPASWPDSAGPVWTPPPGYTSPPGFHSAPPVKPPASAVSGTQLYAVLGVVVIGIVALTFALHSLKPKLVPAPAAYKPYTALDGSFVCDRPVGWKTKEAGMPGGSRAMVTFSSDKVIVEVESDATKLMIANATANPLASTPFAKVAPLVQQMHEKDVQQWMDALPNFKEKQAEPYQSKFGEARVSEWTASKGSLKLHGYRVTMTGTDRAVTVFCLTPERNWVTLKPAFQRIITSVGPGSG